MTDIQNILQFDQDLLLALNGSNSLFLDGWMACLTCGFTWIPLYVSLLYLVIKNNETMAQILLILGCSLLCVVMADGVADFIVKPLVGRWRPSNDPFIKYAVRVVGGMRGSDYGFFSAHAANTFSIAIFFCLLVRSKILSTSLIVWSLVNCYTRMYLGLHYPLDILCGLLWGGVVGIVSYIVYHKVYSRIAPANNYISANTFSIAIFFCLLVRSKILSTSLIVWSLVNCYTRMYLGLHYPLDILCGLLWGGVVGIVSYIVYHKVYSRIAPANNYISTQYTSTGYSLSDIDIVELVLVLTFIYTVIAAVLIYN